MDAIEKMVRFKNLVTIKEIRDYEFFQLKVLILLGLCLEENRGKTIENRVLHCLSKSFESNGIKGTVISIRKIGPLYMSSYHWKLGKILSFYFPNGEKKIGEKSIEKISLAIQEKQSLVNDLSSLIGED